MSSSFPMVRVVAAFLVFAFAGAPVNAALTNDASLHWQTLTSRHFQVHFHDGEDQLARKAIAIAEQAHARLSKRFNWIPHGRTEIVLNDRVDFPNGYASPYPTNRITVYVNPPDEIDSLEDHGDWLETVITHEYTHILHLDKAKYVPEIMRDIFGRVPFPVLIPPIPFFPVFPNAWQPSWMIEGLATYIETEKERGIGRGQSNYFRMLMRMEVAGGVKPVRQVNQPIASWPAGTVPYLYGVEYHNFIADKKGEDKIFRLVENYSGSTMPYRVNTNSKRVFRKNLNRMWDEEFAVYLAEKYRTELAAIEARGLREGERLTQDGYYGGPVRALADGRVVYLRHNGRAEPALMLINNGATEHLADAHTGARFDLHPTAGVLVAQPERYRNANIYYDLYRYDLVSGSRKRLTHAGRYHYGVWMPDGNGIIAVQGGNGGSSLHLLNSAGEHKEVLSELGANEVISDPDMAPDGGSLAAAVWRPAGGWNIERFSLSDRRWQPLTHDSAIESQPRFTPDGKSVLFTSDHGGVYNLRRLDLASGEVTTLTNVRGGAFYPAATSDHIYYSGYGPQGFDIYRVGANEPALPLPPASAGTSAVVAPPAPEPADLGTTDYSPWRSLAPRWWLPHVLVDIDRTEVGAMTAGEDTLSRHFYGIDAAYDFSNRNFVGAIDYIYDRWFPIFKLHASRAPEFSRDKEGNLLRVRRNDIMQAEMVLPAIFYRRSWSLHFAVVHDRESDDRVEPGVDSIGDTQDNLAGAAVVYDSTRNYPLSISRAGGQQLALIAESSDVFGASDYNGEVYTADWRGFAGLGGEHVLALRLLGGWGSDDPQPFQLGGLGAASYNSALSVIASPVTANMLFDQREYGLRGYASGVPQLTGRRMGAASIEYRFPIARVERGFMVPFPGALDQIHAKVFADRGAAWDGDKPERYYTGAGVELDADLVFGYSAPLSLSVGYAHGFDEDIGDNRYYWRLGAQF